MSQLRQYLKLFGKPELSLLPISFETDPNLSITAVGQPPALNYFVDPERTLYHHYSMHSAGFWDIWGPRSWMAYMKLLVKGQKIRKSGSDIHQRGGDVLIDPNGIIRLHHVGAGPGDRPQIQDIFNLITSGNHSFSAKTAKSAVPESS